MRVDRGFTLPVPVDRAWVALNDVDRIGGLLSCAAKGQYDQRRFSGVLNVRLGPFALVYRGSGRVIEVDPVARRILIEAAGVDIHGGGTAAASMTVTLHPDRHGQTRVMIGAELSASGWPVQYAGQSLHASATRLVDRFGRALAVALASGASAEPECGASVEPVAVRPARRHRWFLPCFGLVFVLGGGIGWLVARLIVQ